MIVRYCGRLSVYGVQVCLQRLSELADLARQGDAVPAIAKADGRQGAIQGEVQAGEPTAKRGRLEGDHVRRGSGGRGSRAGRGAKKKLPPAGGG